MKWAPDLTFLDFILSFGGLLSGKIESACNKRVEGRIFTLRASDAGFKKFSRLHFRRGDSRNEFRNGSEGKGIPIQNTISNS